jgi:hypothetical protein
MHNVMRACDTAASARTWEPFAGGAGTTAAGLLAGCPTTIVPFFGDQAFWGEAVRRAGVGPKPIPVDSLSKHQLVQALHFMAQPEVSSPARTAHQGQQCCFSVSSDILAGEIPPIQHDEPNQPKPTKAIDMTSP